MKKYIKNSIIIIILIIIMISFYKINNLNYLKYKDIKKSFVVHPENLPTKNTAKDTSLGFQNLKADIYWLESIQYIGANAIGAEYKKYLYAMLDIITELNPYFKHPYIIGQLLLPDYNQRYEKISKKEQNIHINESIKLGLKGIKNFCNKEKINLIKKQDDLIKIWSEKKYKNPCKEFEIPYYLAYIYHYYKNDPKTASIYYKIASANDNSLEGSKVLAAIMAGKGGEREKSYFMFLSIAKNLENKKTVCTNFSTYLEKLGTNIFINKKIILNKSIIEDIANIRDKIFGKFTEEKEEQLLGDTNCGNYLNKAIRELNIKYIENGDKKYFKKYGKHSKDANQLYKKGFIDYLPIDYQQYKDYGIIYEFNSDTGNYNYTLGNYNK